jgi:hypothetical protein
MKFMKVIQLIVSSLLLLAFLTCTIKEDAGVINIKDLDENMIDIRVYHELMGDELRKGNIADAQWFFTGMDSILQIVSVKYDRHRKLDEPFAVSYEKNLKPAIDDLESSLRQSNLEASRNAYTVLTKKCNKCHLDNDIDKVVQNWLKRGE